MGKALPAVYLKQFQNNVTNTINTKLPIILQPLFTTYGDIDAYKIKDKQVKLEVKVFDIQEPLQVLNDEVEEFQELSTAANLSNTPAQLVAIGEQLIKNTNDFKRGIDEWYTLPAANWT